MMTAGALALWMPRGQAEFEIEDGADRSCRMDVETPPARSRSLADGVKILPLEGRVYPGVYSIGSTIADYRRFEADTGYRPALLYTFHDWVSDDDWSSENPTLRTFDDPLEGETISPLQLAETLADRGSILAVSWAVQCCQFDSTLFWLGLKTTKVSVPRVLTGEYDGYVRKVARQIKRFNKPIMISVFSEFPFQGIFSFGEKGNELIRDVSDICGSYGDPMWPDGPERIRDVFRHVIDLFREEGVRNVTWFMYAASRYMDPSHEDYSPWLHPRFFYPGDEYMDWVGQSAYFFKSGSSFEPDDESAPMDQALRAGYESWRTVTNRPIFLPEFAAYARGPEKRAELLREAFMVDLPSMPQVKAFTIADAELFEKYFDIPRFGTFADDLSVWKEVIGDNPYYDNSIRLPLR